MQNRCGAIGIIRRINNEMVFEVREVVAKIQYERLTLTVPADLKVGELISMDALWKEHRGLVILDNRGEFIDEGEVERRRDSSKDRLVFVSDHDDGLFSGIPVDKLVCLCAKIKPEIHDEIGARRRLAAIRQTFRGRGV